LAIAREIAREDDDDDDDDDDVEDDEEIPTTLALVRSASLVVRRARRVRARASL